jgi:hypothetical protein
VSCCEQLQKIQGPIVIAKKIKKEKKKILDFGELPFHVKVL